MRMVDMNMGWLLLHYRRSPHDTTHNDHRMFHVGNHNRYPYLHHNYPNVRCIRTERMRLDIDQRRHGNIPMHIAENFYDHLTRQKIAKEDLEEREGHSEKIGTAACDYRAKLKLQFL